MPKIRDRAPLITAHTNRSLFFFFICSLDNHYAVNNKLIIQRYSPILSKINAGGIWAWKMREKQHLELAGKAFKLLKMCCCLLQRKPPADISQLTRLNYVIKYTLYRNTQRYKATPSDRVLVTESNQACHRSN